MTDFAIIGIDISKATLDVFCRPADQGFTVKNHNDGFKAFVAHLQQLLPSQASVLVVMEHTGLYSRQLELFLQTHGIAYCKVPALQIKRSMGMTRGKDDRIDARRIAQYGWLRRELLSADQPLTKNLSDLKALLSLRLMLVRNRAGWRSRFKEVAAAAITVGIDQMQKCIDESTVHIENVEQQIRDLIADNQALTQTYQLLCSIKGVGFIVAASMIATTHNFVRFSNARKFNCYSGIAPFKHQSGSSIKGKSRVSHLANKDNKTLLNLAAMNAVRYNQELKDYYNRKVGEGKNKMACLNAVRAKIVARMFAIIKRQTPYQEHRLSA